MPSDALLAFQATAITKTAAFDSAAITAMPTGTSKQKPAVCRVIYSAASTSSGAGSATFGIKVSLDGGSSFIVLVEAAPIVLSTTPKADVIYIPFIHTPGHYQANTPQYCLSLVAISGTGATVTYQGFFDAAYSYP